MIKRQQFTAKESTAVSCLVCCVFATVVQDAKGVQGLLPRFPPYLRSDLTTFSNLCRLVSSPFVLVYSKTTPPLHQCYSSRQAVVGMMQTHTNQPEISPFIVLKFNSKLSKLRAIKEAQAALD